MPTKLKSQGVTYHKLEHYAWLFGLVWTLLVAGTATMLFTTIHELAVFCFLILWLVGIAFVYAVSRRLRRSEEKLRAAEQELWESSQNLEIKIMERTNELQMANMRLKEEVEERLSAESALSASEMKYRIVADNTYGWEFWLNPEGRFVYSSPSCREIAGYGAEEFIADAGLFRHIIFPEDLTLYLDHRRDVEQEFKTDSVAFRIVRADNSLRWIGHVCQPVYDDVGGFIGTRGSNRDISERKKAEDEIKKLNEDLENRVRKRTAQLEASNRELEGFCYSISHDLRAPLARLEGYSRAILEDCSESLDPLGRQYAERINKSSIQLKAVIDILMDLTMLTRSNLKIEEVNLSEMCLTILQELRNDCPERIVESVVAPGVIVKGDQRLLLIAMKSLFDNAWKYTEKHASATIEFGLIQQKGRKTYFIRDDGAGFDMKFAKKMFKPFERVHREDEFSGLGVGLATVQRIIQRHGGKIWAEGEIEKGATIFFAL